MVVKDPQALLWHVGPSSCPAYILCKYLHFKMDVGILAWSAVDSFLFAVIVLSKVFPTCRIIKRLLLVNAYTEGLELGVAHVLGLSCFVLWSWWKMALSVCFTTCSHTVNGVIFGGCASGGVTLDQPFNHPEFHQRLRWLLLLLAWSGHHTSSAVNVVWPDSAIWPHSIF